MPRQGGLVTILWLGHSADAANLKRINGIVKSGLRMRQFCLFQAVNRMPATALGTHDISLTATTVKVDLGETREGKRQAFGPAASEFTRAAALFSTAGLQTGVLRHGPCGAEPADAI